MYDYLCQAHPKRDDRPEFVLHDVLSHICGGGRPGIPGGEVYGEMMEFVFSTPQVEAVQPGTKQKLRLTVPSFEAFLKTLQYRERMEEIDYEDYYSKKDARQLYRYAIYMFGIYVRMFGIEKGKGLFGVDGPKQATASAIWGWMDYPHHTQK